MPLPFSDPCSYPAAPPEREISVKCPRLSSLKYEGDDGTGNREEDTDVDVAVEARVIALKTH